MRKLKKKQIGKLLRQPVHLKPAPGAPLETVTVQVAQEIFFQALQRGHLGLAEFLATQLSQQVVVEPVANFLLSALQKKNDYPAMEATAKRLVTLEPKYAEGYNALCEASRRKGDFDAALAAIKTAGKLAPTNASYRNHLGLILKETGDLDGALKCFNQAIALDHHLYAAYQNRADLGFALGDAEIRDMQQLCAQMPAGVGEEVHFALGHALERQRHYEEAFSHWEKGNRLKRQSIDFEVRELVDQHREIERCFTPELLGPIEVSTEPDMHPVFIVGFPRSGSTLVEQIISSHSGVDAAGETAWMQRSIEATMRDAQAWALFPAGFERFGSAEFQLIADRYLAHARARESIGERFTDKTLFNYAFIGVIKAILPAAQIVHVRRNPQDTMLGCYRQNFAGSVLYSYDLGDLCEAYRAYSQLMAHWDNVFPGAIYHLDYENLVNQPQQEIGGLLEYCGLGWEDQCLDFYNNKRGVMTASSAQIRQPLFREGIERWRRYKAFLPDSFTGFEP